MPEISIIIPVYKVEKYLHRCVDSILAQTFTDFELLLIDDGSPDNSGAICDEYAAKDSRVRVFHKENGGVSSARNLGLDHAQGEYIMFCDSDDFVADCWAEELHRLISSDEVDLGICGYKVVNSSSALERKDLNIESVGMEIFTTVHELEMFWRGFLRNENTGVLATWNKIFRSQIVRECNVRFDEALSHSEDAFFVFDYMRVAKGATATKESKLYFYVNDMNDSLTKRYKTDFWAAKQQGINKLLQIFESKNLDISKDDPDFCTYIITVIAVALNNVLSEKNTAHFTKRISEGQEILKSEECKISFMRGKFLHIHPVYKAILKTRCFFLVWLFHELLQIKHKLFGVRSERNT